MAVRWTNTHTNTSGNANVSVGSGTTAGDVLIFGSSVDGQKTFTWPSGFTELMRPTKTTGDTQTLGIAYKIADGTESGTLTATISGGGNHASFVTCISGRAASPLDVYASVVDTTTSGTTITGPSSVGTPSVDGCDILWIATLDHSGGAVTYTGPAATTSELVDANNNDFASICCEFWNQATAASLNSLSGSSSWSGTGKLVAVIALKPAGGGGITLSGSSTTAGRGDVSPASALALTGAAATPAAGSVGAALARALTGAAATTASGSAGVGVSVALTGTAATLSRGTVTAGGNVTAALTGAALTSTPGTLGTQSAAALAGQAATVSRGLLGANLAASLSGSAGSAAAGSLGAQSALALTGAAVTSARGSVTAGNDVTAALTGQALTGSAGQFAPGAHATLSGSAITSAPGTLTPVTGLYVVLTGLELTGSRGALGIDLSALLTGAWTESIAGSLSIPGSSVVADVTGGAFWAAFARERARRRRERREREERERESQRIEDETSRSIASMLREQERIDARREELGRLEALVKRYRSAPEPLPQRVEKAMSRAIARESSASLMALDRELRRAMEEEEFVMQAAMMILSDS